MLELSAVYSELRKARLTKDHLRNYCVQLVLSQDITVRELVAEVLAAVGEAPLPATPGRRDRRVEFVAPATEYLAAQGVKVFTAEMVTGAVSKMAGSVVSPTRAAKELSRLGYKQLLDGAQLRCSGRLCRAWAPPDVALLTKPQAVEALEQSTAVWQKLWKAGYPGLVEVAP